MQQAVFYSNIYFLLPPEYEDFASFRAAAAAAPKPFQVRAVVLRENHKIPGWNVQKGVCMAPYFLTGYHDEPSLLRISDPEELLPAQVELLSQEEYNARLRRLVTDDCPGCTRYRPFSNRVQSLNGHFEEIALDGFCAYRVESKPSPRCFRELLFFFGYRWKTFSYGEAAPEELCQNLKKSLYLRLDKPRLEEREGRRTWSARAKTAFDAQVTRIVSRYIREVFDPNYHILSEFGGTETDERWEPGEDESFRADCRRYGLSVLTLTYEPDGAGKLRRSLAELVENWCLFPLRLSEGCDVYFALDTPAVLKGLHYRLPLLRTLRLTAEMSGQYASKRYLFSDTMQEA